MNGIDLRYNRTPMEFLAEATDACCTARWSIQAHATMRDAWLHPVVYEFDMLWLLGCDPRYHYRLRQVGNWLSEHCTDKIATMIMRNEEQCPFVPYHETGGSNFCRARSAAYHRCLRAVADEVRPELRNRLWEWFPETFTMTREECIAADLQPKALDTQPAPGKEETTPNRSDHV